MNPIGTFVLRLPDKTQQDANQLDNSNTINLKLFPTRPSPPLIHAYQVPTPTISLSSLSTPICPVLTSDRILPYINAIHINLTQARKTSDGDLIPDGVACVDLRSAAVRSDVRDTHAGGEWPPVSALLEMLLGQAQFFPGETKRSWLVCKPWAHPAKPGSPRTGVFKSAFSGAQTGILKGLLARVDLGLRPGGRGVF